MEIRLEKMENKNNEVFFRYRIGDFKFWFAQRVNDGDIFAVYIACDNKEYEDFELYVVANEEDARWYPNEFALRGKSSRMTTAEAEVYMKKMTEVCKVLDAIQYFFKTSFHAKVRDLKVEGDFGSGSDTEEYWVYKIGDLSFGFKQFKHNGEILEVGVFDDKNKYEFFELCVVCHEKDGRHYPNEFFLKNRFPDMVDESMESCGEESGELEFVRLKIKEFFETSRHASVGKNNTNE